jgi:hypothetical protein
MPTIDIPDKVCSHCGGTRWCMFKKKDWRSEKFHETTNYYTNYSCANITENGCARLKRLKYNPLKPRVKVTKEYTRNRVNEYARKNKHKWISQSKEKNRETAKRLYYSNPKYKERMANSAKKYALELTDAHVRKIITNKSGGLLAKDIPQELIELKRKQLLLKRKIKNNGKENNQNN